MTAPNPGPGEARLQKRQRIQVITMFAAAAVAGGIGFLTGYFDEGDGNLLAGDWNKLKLSPALAVLIAALCVAVFLIMPIRDMRKADDYQREVSLIAFTGGFFAVATGFPVWAVLHAGGFVPPPHAFGIFALAYVAMCGSFLFARWRL
jgi:drug/metabolite transporter (DMT)-like permease